MEKLIESVAFSMAAPTVIDVTWDKRKCDTYMLSADRSFFLGRMHPTGSYLLYSTIKECRQYLMFLSCRYRGFSNWAPCARSMKKFNLISTDVTYHCGLILIIGIAYEDTKDSLNYTYL